MSVRVRVRVRVQHVYLVHTDIFVDFLRSHFEIVVVRERDLSACGRTTIRTRTPGAFLRCTLTTRAARGGLV